MAIDFNFLDNGIKHLDILSGKDKLILAELRSSLNCGGYKSAGFSEIISSLKRFCMRNEPTDNDRCLVCGIYWAKEGIAINFRKLRTIINMPKSQIISGLNRMGYNLHFDSRKCVQPIDYVVPMLQDYISEQREWHYYKSIPVTPKPFANFQKVELLHTPEPQIALSTPKAPSIDDMESLFDDPFSLPPMFLFEDVNKMSICASPPIIDFVK